MARERCTSALSWTLDATTATEPLTPVYLDRRYEKKTGVREDDARPCQRRRTAGIGSALGGRGGS